MYWGGTWRLFWRAGQVKRSWTSRLMSHTTGRTVLSFTGMEMVEAKQFFEFSVSQMETRKPEAGVGGRQVSIPWVAERIGLNDTRNLSHFCSHFSSIKISFNMSLLTANQQKPTTPIQMHFPETSMKHMNVLTRFWERDDRVCYASRSSF